MYAIDVKGLTKTYESKERKGLFKSYKKKVIAVDHIYFNVKYGEIFGLLGPNGAGKTTTVKMLATLLIPDEGDAWVNGYHIVSEASKVRNSIGLMLSVEKGFYPRLTGYENLKYFALLYGIPRREIDERVRSLLRLVGLTELGGDKKLYEEFSLGMKARLSLARALLKDPPVLLLDEPTLGLDPASARKVRELLVDLKKEGKAILLTTHNMFEAEMLCDRIAIINKGRIIAIGTSEELKSKIRSFSTIEIECIGITESLKVKLNDIPNIVRVELVENEVSKIKLLVQGNVRAVLSDVLDVLKNIKIKDLKIHEPTLEDVFIELTRS